MNATTGESPLSKGTQLVGPSSAPSPLVLCFHGSGEDCSSWRPLASLLTSSHRVLLYDRGAIEVGKAAASTAAAEMLAYLAESPNLSLPYILVAHSYGGAVAREFLEQALEQVVGVVLVETGQETAINTAVEEVQYSRKVLGDRPLSVIRGNSLIAKWKELERREEGGEVDGAHRALLKMWDEEDVRLKKRQLALSRRNRYIHISDCGHHVVRDRPEVVAEEVEWVMKNWNVPMEQEVGTSDDQGEKGDGSTKKSGIRERVKGLLKKQKG